MSALEDARKRAREASAEVARLEQLERTSPRARLAEAAETYVRLQHDIGTCHDPLVDLETAAREYVARTSRAKLVCGGCTPHCTPIRCYGSHP